MSPEGLETQNLARQLEPGGARTSDFEIDADTGVIYGKLDTAGNYDFTVVVENDAGSSEFAVSLTVVAPTP
ncbi:MAG: hypothetical protein ACYTGZ_22955 [Planctomycetota bacterium]